MPVPNTAGDETVKIPAPKRTAAYPPDAQTLPSLASVRPPLTGRSARPLSTAPRAVRRTPAPAPVAAPATQATPRLLFDAGWYRALYGRVNRLSGGKASTLEQLGAFLVVGGSAALVNLLVIQAFDMYNTAHPQTQVPYLALTAIATEISLLCNFVLNDSITFRHQIDRGRTYLQRCVRFHGPASVGFFLTLILSYVFHLLLPRSRPIVPQAIAILIVTFVNFAMHKFWTYRPKRRPAPAAAR